MVFAGSCRAGKSCRPGREKEYVTKKMKSNVSKEPLFTNSFRYILAANFLLFFAFYLLLPVLPFYLSEQFSADRSTIGVVLACYTVAALCIRPFSGYLLDAFARKPLYMLSYFVFTAIFGGYVVAGTLALFVALRIVHGAAFGMVTVAGNTVVVDIMPASRRGEGLGYYGLANNIAMSFGPMAGLFMHGVYSYQTIFVVALLFGRLGLTMAGLVKTPHREPVVRDTPVSLDRFLLLQGVPAGISLLLLSIPYGMTTTYVAMYAQEIGMGGNPGLYFTFMAVGLAVSRLFSGRQVDKGRISSVIALGMFLACASFFALAECGALVAWNPQAAPVVFLAIALLQGVAFGTMFPAFNTLFVNLAPNDRRGTATSTYLISWDVGIGIGLSVAGAMAQAFGGFARVYLFGGCLSVVATVFFLLYAAPHFNRHKLR